MVAGVRKGTAEFYVPRNARYVKCQQSLKNAVECMDNENNNIYC